MICEFCKNEKVSTNPLKVNINKVFETEGEENKVEIKKVEIPQCDMCNSVHIEIKNSLQEDPSTSIFSNVGGFLITSSLIALVLWIVGLKDGEIFWGIVLIGGFFLALEVISPILDTIMISSIESKIYKTKFKISNRKNEARILYVISKFLESTGYLKDGYKVGSKPIKEMEMLIESQEQDNSLKKKRWFSFRKAQILG